MRMQRWMVIGSGVVLAGLLALPGAASPDDDKSLKDELPRIPVTEPAEAIKTFRTLKGICIELVAAEPLVVDPIDMAFDEDGRIWVIEMIDYPFGEKEKNPPQGRVRILEDTDGDGRVDRSFVFADKLAWPTGLALWDGGVFVAAAPDILYLKDTDGDNVADRREVVFSGFGKANVQALVNNIKWGVDNWFYGASGGNGGDIRSSRKPGTGAVTLSGRDYRFRPTGEFEPQSGGGQFGNTLDDFGRRFVCNNSNQARQIVLEHRYLARNPQLPVPAVIQSIASDGDSGPVYRTSPPEPWRVVRTRLRVAGTVPGPIEFGGKASGYFTSATGITVFRGTALGDDFYGNLIIGDVASNLVHRKRLSPNGVLFRADRVEQNSEFITSTDIWFRPCNFANGPDGALYICDMYREVIEHPLSIPEIIQKHYDLTSGKDRGRIWRVTREGAPPYRRPQLGKASTAELVEALRRRDGWWRETAARLLFQRQDKSAVPHLEKLVGDAQPETRAAVLWALDGLGSLRPELVRTALQDKSPDVREQAVRLAEPRAAQSRELRESLFALTEDPNSRVRFQLAYTLGELDDARSGAALARLAARDGADTWIRTAIFSSLGDAGSSAGSQPGRVVTLLQALAGDTKRVSAVPIDLLEQLGQLIGIRNQAAELSAAAQAVAGLPAEHDERQWALLLGLGDGQRRIGKKLWDVLGGTNPDVPKDTHRAAKIIIGKAAGVAANSQAPEARRIAAIRLLPYGSPGLSVNVVPPLLGPRNAQAIQLAAIRALGAVNTEEVAPTLLAAWKTYSPVVRREVLEAVIGRPDRIAVLLDHLERGQVQRGDLELDRRKQLLGHPNATVRARAQKLLGSDAITDRSKVIAAYRPALEQPGDPERGKPVFRKVCATCHKLGGEGHEVGPDLATVKERTPDALLEQILDPNREINPVYINYTLATTDGRVMTGIIAGESATSVTLKRAEGAGETVLRTSIDELVSTGISIMPEGVEKEITPEQMADIIALLRRGG